MMREAVEDFRKSRGRLNLCGKKVILASVGRVSGCRGSSVRKNLLGVCYRWEVMGA